MRGIATLALALAALQAPGKAASQPRPGASYVIIVNPKNPETEVDRSFLEGAFLKKISRWRAVDELRRPDHLVDSAPARRRFSQEILERSVESVKGYWQQRIFSGRDV